MNIFGKLIISVLMALSVLSASSSALAWETTPLNPTDVSLQTYLRGKYGGTDKTVITYFYNSTEHLTFVNVNKTSTGELLGWYFHSNQTKIGNMYILDVGVAFKLMCPDGHSATIKRHIEITKSIYRPNTYKPSDVTGGVCGYVPPPNQTDINVIKALYPPEFTVTRLWANQDIFSVRCTTSPECDYWNVDVGMSFPTNGVVYFSNTQKIGLRKFSHNTNDQWVAIRTKDTVTNQTAKDDIDLLTASGVEGQPWLWVNYSSDFADTFWFN